jgi:tetratricopeptide (TPR) repeat protein
VTNRIRFLFFGLIATLILSQSDVAPAYGQYYPRYGYGLDDGIGAFGGGYRYYPGRAFGFPRSYLASRAISAYGGFGTVSYGTPQPPPAPPEPRRPATLLRAAKEQAGDRVLNGEAAFWDGDYNAAIDNWCKEIAAGRSNPVLAMMLGQAYFAAGQYREAAGATQAGMRALPPERWGVVVSNRSELYSDPEAYKDQLRKLETAVRGKPEDPALRFLLGYHYAYMGYPEAGLAQLDRAVKLDPEDELAMQFRETLKRRAANPGAPVITPGLHQ